MPFQPVGGTATRDIITRIPNPPNKVRLLTSLGDLVQMGLNFLGAVPGIVGRIKLQPLQEIWL